MSVAGLKKQFHKASQSVHERQSIGQLQDSVMKKDLDLLKSV